MGHIWNSGRPKEQIIDILANHYKPKSPAEEEKLEYNELNILAEYQLHNLIFLKNELLLDDN